MKKTNISWTHHTFNGWIGCTRVSPGCDDCFAATQVEKLGLAKWGQDETRIKTGEVTWNAPLQWNRAIEKSGGENERVLCMSWGDFFDAKVNHAWRDEVRELIDQTPRLDWLLLTKRPKEAVKYYEAKGWPDNAWIGTSIENQAVAYRAEIIKKIPAPVRFLSIEPLLEPVKIDLKEIDWAIVGGESGRDYRYMGKPWVLDLQRQCLEANVPFFFKQWASTRQDGMGHELNGEVLHAIPTPKNRKAAAKPEAAVKSDEVVKVENAAELEVAVVE